MPVTWVPRQVARVLQRGVGGNGCRLCGAVLWAGGVCAQQAGRNQQMDRAEGLFPAPLFTPYPCCQSHPSASSHSPMM